MDEMDPLVAAVYNFLVTEGYHGHYPTAEEQAEKFVSSLRTEGWVITPPGKRPRPKACPKCVEKWGQTPRPWGDSVLELEAYTEHEKDHGAEET